MDITELDLLLRALASPSRLELIRALANAPPDLPPEAPGTTPSELADRLALSRSAVSHHLKILLRMRLVRYWKKGVHKFYTPARSRAGTVRERLLQGMAESLPAAAEGPRRKPPGVGGRGVRPARHRNIAKSPLAGVWGALTAFSNFRRILMWRVLERDGDASRADLMRAADLDRKTVKYHLSKLARRGLLTGDSNALRLCDKPPTPLHGLVLALVTVH